MSEAHHELAKAPPRPAPEPLDAADTARLMEFARACKAAARAVVLYPGGHPAIAATLGRIAQITAAAALPAPLRITVLPETLLLDNRAPARADSAVAELAVLLHSHLIGEMKVHPGGDVEAWRAFLLLLRRPRETGGPDRGSAPGWTPKGGSPRRLRADRQFDNAPGPT